MNQPCEPPALSPASHGFFFDVDGTLAPIQSQPDNVTIAPRVIAALTQLAAASGQALALISGRPLNQLDSLFFPLHLPLAGIHGAERRDSSGSIYNVLLPQQTYQRVVQILHQAVITMPSVTLENKNVAFTLHYRSAPHMASEVLALAQTVASQFRQLTLQPGKCVAELKPAGCDKGTAITAFMQEVPFRGRIPVFIGDDLTDESGFAVVNTQGGYTIKVGGGQTLACYRLADAEAVHTWLEQLILQ